MYYLMKKYGIYLKYQNVCCMLSNELYKGCKHNNANVLSCPNRTGTFRPFTGKKNKNVRVRSNNRCYVFSGFIFCSSCNHIMVGNTNCCKQHGYKKYRCNQYHLAKICIHKSMITEDKLERLVLDNIKPAIQAYIAKYDVHTAAPDKINDEASKLNDNLKNLKELFINGYIEFEEFKSRCDDILIYNMLNCSCTLPLYLF